VLWATHQVGYSDLHPWTEFGEEPLSHHLDSLMKIQFSPLAEASMELNYIDREYRLLKRNAFLGMILPRTHRLVTEIDTLDSATLLDWDEQGFSHIKLKMGNDLRKETQLLVQLALSSPMLWRLDFNGKLNVEEFTNWWNSLDPAVRARVDFVEDPVGKGQLKIAGPWANDWAEQKNARIRVLKPARESTDDVLMSERVIFTHGLDHPLGQAAALWIAGRYYAQHPKRIEVCGLGATDLYEPDHFSRSWYCPGPRMRPTTGTGFGFDEILESLKWEQIL